MRFLRKFALVIGLIPVLFLSSGCSYRAGDPQVTNLEVKPDEAKYGTARCFNILFLFNFGKCTVGKAIDNGGIKQVQSVDYKSFYSFFYNSKVVEVRGK